MAQELGDFTPIEVTKLGQLENLLLREQEVREHRAMTGGVDAVIQFDNPDFRPQHFDQPISHTIIFDKALLRGMMKMKKTLHDDIVYDVHRRIQPEKKMIVNGIIEAYSGNQR